MAVEQDLAAGGWIWPPSTFSSVLLPQPLAPITQTISPRLSAKEMPSSAISPLPKRWLTSLTSRRANDVAFFLDDALGEIAAQELADIDADGVAIRERRA